MASDEMDDFRTLLSHAPILALHHELVRFVGFIEQTPEERARKDAMIARIEQVVTNLWPGCRLSVFGSSVTNLCLPDSDVDMCVFGSDVDPKDAIYLLGLVLRQLGGIRDMEEIKSARVPIIKFKDLSSDLNVDVCFDQSSGMRTAAYVRRMLEKHRLARPLVMIVKYFLSQRGLNETYTGGFGSFMVTLLVFAYVQHLDRTFGPTESQRSNLGTLLLGFFHFYGNQFNAVASAITLANGGRFVSKKLGKKSRFDERRPQLMSVENPDEPDADVGKNSWAVTRVRCAFLHAFHVLRFELTRDHSKDDEERTILGKIIAPDDTIAGRADKIFLKKT